MLLVYTSERDARKKTLVIQIKLKSRFWVPSHYVVNNTQNGGNISQHLKTSLIKHVSGSYQKRFQFRGVRVAQWVKHLTLFVQVVISGS